MITKEMVAKAYKRGLIQLEIDPNMEHGTVARIGEYWFYFGGQSGDEMNPDEYQKNVPEEDIVNELYDVLDEFQTENPTEYAYYEATLQAVQMPWLEVKCEHLDQEDQCWRVDAWETDNDAEEGKVIAYINDITGVVIYTDPLARVDKLAQEVIQEKVKNLGPTLKIRRKECDIEVSMETALGDLVADFEPDAMAGSGYDAVYIGMQASKDPDVYFDLQSTHVTEDGLSLYSWDDVFDEDWQTKKVIALSDIQELIGDNKVYDDLPTECCFPLTEIGYPEDASPEEISDSVSDFLSDTYGFCHTGFQYCVKDGVVYVSEIEWDTTD